MTILERLEADHRRFLAILGDLNGRVLESRRRDDGGWTESAGRAALEALKELLPALAAHEEIERRLLFPELLRRVPAMYRILEDLEKGHGALDALVARFLKELPGAGAKPTAWMILNLIRLTSLLQNHILQEEEDIFAVAYRHLSEPDLERLGRQAQALEG